MRPPSPVRRIVVVSNRLPFAVDPDGRDLPFRPTVGGLATGIDSFFRGAGAPGAPRPERLWIGWPGAAVPRSRRVALRARALRTRRALPVFLEEEERRGFYEGFSNSVLWPLFHYFPGRVAIEGADWDRYRAVNGRFRDALLGSLRPGDAAWVHDYHLLLLPALVRERAPGCPLLFFLHVPFPPFQVLRVLPDEWSSSLVRGMLGADVVGFQTYDDVRNFASAAERLLGAESRDGAIHLGDRRIRVDAFPIGVDFRRLDGARRLAPVGAALARFRRTFRGRRVVISVDRLDYTKGILNRLQAFELFLERNPRWHRRVTMVAVVVPSREGIGEYRDMRRQVEEAVGRINGRFGRMGWTPLNYQYRALPFPRLAALYLAADVAMVTPLRDGMNLVAKEYLAARGDEGGVLLLGETAGAARELGEALVVNPYHADAVAEGLLRALEMPAAERRRRNRIMRERLRRYDATRWGLEQFGALREAVETTRALRARLLRGPDRRRLLAEAAAAPTRLVLLDYDGTLVPFHADPALAVPGDRVRRALRDLAAAPGTRVVVLSGRGRESLDGWLGDLPVALVAEHGAFVRERGKRWRAASSWDRDWVAPALRMLDVFADRLPGSHVERKESSIAWHWRAADPDVGAVRSGELVAALSGILAGKGARILRGNRVVEVRPAGVHKGTAARRWLPGRPGAFLLALGDDVTDEDMFAALPPRAWSVRIGLGDSRARFNLPAPEDALRLVEDLARR